MSETRLTLGGIGLVLTVLGILWIRAGFRPTPGGRHLRKDWPVTFWSLAFVTAGWGFLLLIGALI
jgi:hypothetical protein